MNGTNLKLILNNLLVPNSFYVLCYHQNLNKWRSVTFWANRIIHDNSPQFASQVFYRFCDRYRIQNVASTAYNPAANSLAEAFCKIIIKLLKKFISSNKRDWTEKLSECLWAYEPQFGPR